MKKKKEPVTSAAVGARIRAIRRERGMSQRELADELGVTPMTISHYERGGVKLSLEMFHRICDALDIPEDYLRLPDAELKALWEKIAKDKERQNAALDIGLEGLDGVEHIYPRFDAVDVAVKIRDRPALRRLFFTAIESDDDAIQIAVTMLEAFNRRKGQ